MEICTAKKIAFIGRGGTGKTTLAKEIADRTGLPLITGQFRIAAGDAAYYCGVKDGLESIRENIICKWLAQIMGFQFQYQNEKVRSKTGFVSDRSMHDYFAYSELVMPGFFYTDLHDVMKIIIEKIEYDHLIYVPPFSTDEQEDDGFRDMSKSGESYNAYVAEKLQSVATWELRSKNLDDRIAEVMDIIKY